MIARNRHRLHHPGRRGRFPRTPDPTPDEIAERAAAIRSTWGPLRLAHATGQLLYGAAGIEGIDAGWQPPIVSESLLAELLME